jgi:hypothetical protein
MSADTEDFVYVPAKVKKDKGIPNVTGHDQDLVPRTGDNRPAVRDAKRAESTGAILSALQSVEPSEDDEYAFAEITKSANDALSEGNAKSPLLTQGEDQNSQLPGVELAESLRARVCNIVVFLGHLGRGDPWSEALKASKLSWIGVSLLKKVDPDGFGRLLASAEAAKAMIDRRQMHEALIKRAVHGVDDVVIGRIGKDQDGVITDRHGRPIVKRKYSDKLLEFAMTKLDKETFGEVSGVQNIGQQVVYNIKGINLGQQVVIDSGSPSNPVQGQKAGGKPAVIDLDSLGNLEE